MREFLPWLGFHIIGFCVFTLPITALVGLAANVPFSEMFLAAFAGWLAVIVFLSLTRSWE